MRMPLEAELGQNPLVPERSQDDALRAWKMEGLQALVRDDREDLLGGILGSVGS
jgi:hypothetical protein